MEKLCGIIEKFVERVGHIAMWSSGFLVLIIILQVVLRYAFHNGLVALEELEWHLYAIGIMVGTSYAMIKDAHIRVDLIHTNLSDRKKQFIELFGILFLLLPFVCIIFHQSIDFTMEAWRVGERSPSPMGLPFRWGIKAFIPIGFGLMILAACSRMLRVILALRRS